MKQELFTKIKLLFCSLLIPALMLSACSPSGTDESSSLPLESNNESSEVSEAVSAEESGEESSDESSSVPKTPAEATYRTVVSKGKSYTGPAAINSYPDTYGSELTDGLYAGNSELSYTDPRWSDYGQPDPVIFVIDLGEVVENIYCFEVSFLHDLGPGIGAPQSVFAQWSKDGEKWEGSTAISTPSDLESGPHIMSRELKKFVSARYIRFSMAHYAANLFLDELSVIADVPPAEEESALSELIDSAYAEDSFDYESALSSLATGTPDYGKVLTSVSTNCSYTFSRNAGTKHPDNNKKLTDGALLGAIYESGNYVGFDGEKALDITLRLGKKQDDISRFEISLYSNNTLGMVLPVYIDVLVSDNNNTFSKVGRIYAPSHNIDGAVTYVLALPKTVSASSVRFSFPEQSRDSLLIEEIGVFAYREEKSENFVSFYKEEELKKPDSEVLFSASDKDYNDRINLISDLGQRIYSYCPLSAGTAGNTPETSGLLTDGKFASKPSYTDPAYFKFGSGEGRDVVYDFGAVAAVDGFSLSFLIEMPVGINSISTVLLYLSEDGVNWYAVKSAALPAESNTEFLRFDYTLDKAYKARFARFSFRVWPNAYCDELEVWGTKNIAKASPLSSTGIDPMPLNVGRYVERDKYLGGANDIVLLPNYSGADERNNKPDAGFSVEDLMPYVAYLDRDGNILDTMFDGALMCPTGSALNGGLFYANATMAEVADMINKTFKEGRDLDALDKAIGIVKESLDGLDDYKFKVYMPITYPGKGVLFGDLDGDGVADRLDTAEDRVAALEWAVDLILQRFEEHTYENIVFSGFYWQHEELNPDHDEQYIISSLSKYTKSLGHELFWIPYYKAAGFDQWHLLGFDLACMQPNYAFSTSVPEKQLDWCAIMTKRLGMCVEIELMEASITDRTYFDRYMRYLYAGLTHGYMTETVHIYYQGVDIYSVACRSESDLARLVYTYTYDFIKGKLQLSPEKEEDSEIATSVNTPYSSTFNKSDSDAASYRLNTSPTNGTVTLTEDGKYTYYPQNGFTGTDSFTYVTSNHLAESEAVTVTITVG